MSDQPREEKGIYVSTAIPLGVDDFLARVSTQIDNFPVSGEFLARYGYSEIPKTEILSSLFSSINDGKRVFNDGGIVSTLGEKIDLYGHIFLVGLGHIPESAELFLARIEREKMVSLNRAGSMELLGKGVLFDFIKSLYNSSIIAFLAPELGKFIVPVLKNPANFPHELGSKNLYLGMFEFIYPGSEKNTIQSGSHQPFLTWLSFRAFKTVFNQIPGSDEILGFRNPHFIRTIYKLSMALVYQACVEAGNLDVSRVVGHWDRTTQRK